MGVAVNNSQKERKNEALIKEHPFYDINVSVNEVCPSICKIETDRVIGTGFLIKLEKNNRPLFCLMTNEHIIKDEMVENKNVIDVLYNNKKNEIKIKLDKYKRFIKSFRDINIDCQIVEILKEDEIDEKIFLLPSINYRNNFNEFKDKKIYILQYPEGELKYSYGEIKYINNYEFHYNVSTSYGSSGSPIFLQDTTRVIGIHKQGAIDGTMNFGDFIFPIINILESNPNELKIVYKYEGNLTENNLNNNNNLIDFNDDNNINNINLVNNYNISDNSIEIFNDESTYFSEKDIADEITIKYKKVNTNIKDFYYNVLVKFNMKETCSDKKFFGEKFVEKNKDKCKIIYKGKEYDLVPYFEDIIKDNIEDNIIIKLKGISKITDCTNMFFGCISLYSLPDIQYWDTKNITDMSSMFTYCRYLNPFPDISGWNTKNVKSFKNFFCYCRDIEYLPDISKWDMSSSENLSHMFDCCLKLKELPDISKWNINNVTDMSFLLAGCLKIEFIPDISKWKTYNVKNIASFFGECRSLIFIPEINKWNIDNIENMSGLFYDCHSLEVLPDISIWNTKNVKNMYKMFCGCLSLSSFPNILKWELNDSVNADNMFNNFSKNALSEQKLAEYKNKFITKSSFINKVFNKIFDNLFAYFYDKLT